MAIDEKTIANAQAGRLLYGCIVDSKGYPNGMDFWEELSPGEKYTYAVIAVQFIEEAVRKGVIPSAGKVGIEGRFGEGDCARLVSHFEETAEDDVRKLEERITAIRSAYQDSQASDGGDKD